MSDREGGLEPGLGAGARWLSVAQAVRLALEPEVGAGTCLRLRFAGASGSGGGSGSMSKVWSQWGWPVRGGSVWLRQYVQGWSQRWELVRLAQVGLRQYV